MISFFGFVLLSFCCALIPSGFLLGGCGEGSGGGVVISRWREFCRPPPSLICKERTSGLFETTIFTRQHVAHRQTLFVSAGIRRAALALLRLLHASFFFVFPVYFFFLLFLSPFPGRLLRFAREFHDCAAQPARIQASLPEYQVQLMKSFV